MTVVTVASPSVTQKMGVNGESMGESMGSQWGRFSLTPIDSNNSTYGAVILLGMTGMPSVCGESPQGA